MKKTIIHHEISESIRINKYLSDAGHCSRRQADRLVLDGRVKINDTLALVGSQVYPNDIVTIDDEMVELVEEKVYMMLHKPLGITCTTDLAIKENIISYMNYPKMIFPVGRLDKNSSGLILMTNDGDIVNKILRAQYGHEKEYLVSVHTDITDTFMKEMEKGVLIYNQRAHKDVYTNPAKITRVSNDTFKIIITQGLNRQIRRMCEALGYYVTKLKRIRIMHLKLGDLQYGTWRYLTDDELKQFNLSFQKQNTFKNTQRGI